MRKLLLKLTALMIIAASLCSMIPFSASAEEEFDNVFEIDINGVDCASDEGRVILYPNDTDTVRYVKSNDYRSNNMNDRRVFVFNADGRLVEVGANLQDNGPQLGVNIPAGGFMVVCRTGSKFDKCYKVVIGDAILANSTISILHEVYASYDDENITLKYNDPEPVPEDAISFLFVGNSSTYFNGSPLKFKGLAKAAGVDIDVIHGTVGNSFLHEFANADHPTGQKLRRLLDARSYNYVVLQDAASCTYETTKPQIQTLLPLIQENGATPLLYMRYSAASTAEKIVENSKKHYNNYSQIAKDFSLTCAPSAEAFNFCATLYPEINLYADDGGHHSKEGSYLIACTWLYSYLGINPVGNTYTADMPAETVAKLQECALKACKDGYFERENNDIFINPKMPPAVEEDVVSEVPESTADVVEEPANKSLTWLYWVIGGIVLVGGIVATILISKKK